MASTTTFLQATNSVLRSINSGQVSSAQFADPTGAQNAREIIQAKEILLEAWREIQNKRPDHWWRQEADIQIAKTYLGSYDIDVPATTGATATNGSTSVTLKDFAALALTSINDMVAADLYFHVVGESQHYRVTSLDTGTGALVLTSEYLGVSGSDKSYELVPFRFSMPSDVRDTLNVYAPNVGKDVEPLSVEQLIEEMSTNSLISTDTWPSYYAVGVDSTGLKKLWIYPFSSTDHYLVLRYLRQQTVPSAAANTFDLDEDAMPQLLNRAKAQAAMEILGGEEGLRMAAYYRALEEEKRDDDTTKQMSRVKSNRMVPNMGEDYRNFYRENTDVDRTKRRIFIRR